MKQGIYNIESGIELENDPPVLPVYLLPFFFFFLSFCESFDRDDGMPLHVTNIGIINRGIDFIIIRRFFEYIFIHSLCNFVG